MQTFAAAGVSPRVRFNSSNFGHIRALVHQGMGYSVVSQSIGSTPVHWNDGVVAVPISDPVPLHYVVVASIRQARLTHTAPTPSGTSASNGRTHRIRPSSRNESRRHARLRPWCSQLR